MWLDLLGRPRRQFHQLPDALPYLDARAAKHATLVEIGQLNSDVDGESANLIITLANANGESTRLFAIPPTGDDAVVYAIERGVAVERFRGVVHQFKLDASSATLELRA